MRFVESMSYEEDRRACRPLVFGLVVAKVSKRLDDGTYELVYESIGSGESSAPARVVMPMAGDRRGVYFMPEKGDEVIVAFEQGDTNLPIVLGALWNQDAKAPGAVRASESGNNVRAIVSRSGHKLVLDDARGQEKVTLATKGGHSLELDDSPGGSKVTLKTAGGLTFQLDDVQKSLTIQVPNSITISTTTLSITATGGISLLANNLLTIDGMPFLAHVHVPAEINTTPTTTGPVKP